MARISAPNTGSPDVSGIGKSAPESDSTGGRTTLAGVVEKPPAIRRSRAGPGGPGVSGPRGFTVYDVMLLGMIVIWAGNPSAIKVALRYMDPMVFNAIRFFLATLLPVGLLLASKETFAWRRGDGPKLFALGLMGHGFYQALFILGLNATLAGNVALVLSINPAFVAVFGALLGCERVRANTWAGVGVSL